MNKFDEIIDRHNTNSEKYDFTVERGKPADILPLWVADMDFRAPEEVLDALHQAVSHGIFGYSEVKSDYYEVIANWFTRFFQWTPKEEWLIKTPGVVFAINAAIRGLTKENDAILIQTPVYYPFGNSVIQNNRKLVKNELVYQNGHYEIDFTDFEKKIADNQVKMFILCSPHNPVGRVWTKEELGKIAEICTRYQVLVVSDEIHCDFTYEGHPHTVFADISKEMEEQCVICTAPSKTFNLAGLQTSNIFIPNAELREKVKEAIICGTGYAEINILGLVACKAAYEKGDRWLGELKEYLRENLDYVRDFLATRIPQIHLVEPEGTYLIWLDCSALGLTDAELEDFIVNKAKLWLDGGNMFGEHCGQFERVNMTCPRSVLQKALEQLEAAVTGIKG
ncbi:MAG: pyridoxal phosphate-dependent aminotransferase [Lachnospiraceae bacterium]|nr:pyridoxal phosphate-dependent aminotransferase [Lachnospiraceae bacterium]